MPYGGRWAVTYEAPILHFLLPKFLRNLEHVRRDARRAHEPRNVSRRRAAELRTPVPHNFRPRSIEAQQRVVRCVQELITLLHVPHTPLQLGREAVEARRAGPDPARVKPDDVERVADGGRDRRPLVPDELRAGPAWAARVDEDASLVVCVVSRRDHTQRDRDCC